MNQAQLREVKSRERWKERERVRNYECTESTLSGLSGVRYCGRSAEAAVLPRTKLVSSEHCHAPVSLRIVALPTATKPVLLFFFCCLHVYTIALGNLSLQAGSVQSTELPWRELFPLEMTSPLTGSGQNNYNSCVCFIVNITTYVM